MKWPTMHSIILSGDGPRNRLLSWLIVALVLFMLVAPFLGMGQAMLNTLIRIAIFVVLVASFDLLLGYTGLISFAHTMFFGIGAYAIGLTLERGGPYFSSLLIGVLFGLALTLILAWVIAIFSIRVRALFFAMITLAVAHVFYVVVTQQYVLTGGHDGKNFHIPKMLRPSNVIWRIENLDVSVTGSTLVYLGIILLCILCFLAMLKIVNSYFGCALMAIRENEFRAEAIGVDVLRCRVIVSCISACFACLAGCLYAVWVKYVSPDATMSIQIMLDILLMTVIGGMGTLYGAIVGSTLYVFAENYLKEVISALSLTAGDIPVLSAIANPDRWIFWLGLLFVLCIYYFPEGIVGRMRREIEHE